MIKVKTFLHWRRSFFCAEAAWPKVGLVATHLSITQVRPDSEEDTGDDDDENISDDDDDENTDDDDDEN